VKPQELEAAITEAHDRGDETRLRALQDEYRRTAPVVRITREPVQLVERSARISTPEGNGNRKVVGQAVPLPVRLTSVARREIGEVEWRDDAEVGGWLLGHVNRVEVVVIRLLGANWKDGVVGDRDSVTMSGAYICDWQERTGLEAVGIWHSHPDTEPEQPLQLSGPDEHAAVNAVHAWGHSMVHLLFGRSSRHTGSVWDPPKWLRPRMQAWLVHSDGSIGLCPISLDPEVYD
jgi:hypothetical protein